MTLVVLVFLMILSIAYNIYAITLNQGIPESISETSYVFHENGKKYYYFSIYCFIVTFALLPIWLNVSKPQFEFLTFLSCAGMMFAGITPLFKEDFNKTIHYTAGILAVIAYVIWMILSGYYMLILLDTFIAGILILIDHKNYTYYVENVGLFTLLFLLIFI